MSGETVSRSVRKSAIPAAHGLDPAAGSGAMASKALMEVRAETALLVWKAARRRGVTVDVLLANLFTPGGFLVKARVAHHMRGKVMVRRGTRPAAESELDSPEFAELLLQLNRSIERAQALMVEARKELDETKAYFAAKRQAP
ncbi:MAG: hypothetical protein U1E53_15955 [Dongiaceae bacterium]